MNDHNFYPKFNKNFEFYKFLKFIHLFIKINYVLFVFLGNIG